MVSCRFRVHPLAGVALVGALSLTPGRAAAEPPATCPNTPADATDLKALKACRGAARGSEGRERATYYATALAIAQKAYLANRTTSPSWLKGDGNNLVHYGTLDCASAQDLEAAEAAKALNGCIQLLGDHIRDLATAGLSDLSAELTRRRDLLRALRDGLQAEAPPPLPPPPQPTTPVPRAPIEVTRPPGPRAVPHGLYAGLGTSAALTVLSTVALGVSWSMGEKAQSKIQAPDTVDPADTGKAACDLSPQPDGCASFERAQKLYVASAIGLGIGAVATAVFGGLLVRHHRRNRNNARTTLIVVPSRGGLFSSLSLRF